MSQQIGLEAVFDMSGWDGGVKKYNAGIADMNKNTSGAVSTLSKGWTDLGSTVTKATAIMGGAVVAAAGAATAAIAGFTVSGIQKAANLEAQLGSIAAVLSKTVDEVAPLKQLILDLAVDPNLKVSATEAADAVEMLARNGLGMTEIMGGAARATVLLANATGADFGTAADIATDAMAIFKIGAEDVEKAVNGIVSVTTSSKFTINDYALALAQGGGVASAAGVEFDDFNTTIAAISPLFASGSDAGTSFKTMLNALTPNSKDAAKLINQLGLEFYDANGQLKSMAEISSELNDAFFQEVKFTSEVSNATAEQTAQRKLLESQIRRTNQELFKYEVGINGVGQTEEQRAKAIAKLNEQHDAAVAAYSALAISQGTTITTTRALTEEERSLAMETIFGSDATRAAIALAEAGNVVYTDLATAVAETGLSQELLSSFMEDGALTAFELLQAQQSLTDANKAAATRVENLKGQMEVFWSVVEGLQIQIGDKFLPILTDLVKMFTGLVSQYTPAIIDAFGAFADNVSALINYIIALVEDGDHLNDWLTHMHPALQDVVLGVVTFTGAVVAAWNAVGAALSPFVQWQDVLIVLGAAIASVVIPAIAGMVAAMAPMILVFAGAVAAVAGLRLAWESNFLGIQDVTTNAIGSIQAVWGDLVAFFEPTIERLRNSFDAFGEKFGGLSEKFGELWAAAQPVLTGLATLIGGVVMVVVVAAIETIAALITRIVDVVGVVVDQFTLLFTSISDAFTNVVALVSAVIAGDWAAAWTAAGALTETGVNLVVGSITNLGMLFGIVFNGLKAIVVNTFSAFGVNLNALLPQFVAALGQWGVAAVRWLTDAIPLAIAALGGFVSSLISNVSTRLAAWVNGWSGWAAAARQWITGAVGSAVSALGGFISSLITNVASRLGSWTSGWAAWAKASWDWITGAVSSATTALGSFVTSLTTSLGGRLQTWKTAFVTWATAAWQWITDSAALLSGKIGEWYTSLSAALSSKLEAWKTAFADWTEAAWQWIIDAKDDLSGKIGEWYTALNDALGGKLDDWQTAFTDWKEAAVEWIVDAKDNLPEKVQTWYTGLAGDVAAKIPTFRAEMLKWATELVAWIGSSAADALPELGKWLGKITTWIALAPLVLAASLSKMARALVGWIAGGEGTAEADSAAGQTDSAMEAFKEALLDALENIKAGFIQGVQEFVTAWSETMTEFVDWNKLGQDILGFIRDGWSSVKETLYNAVTLAAQGVQKRFTDIDWRQLGTDIMTWVGDGVAGMLSSITAKADEIAVGIRDKFTSIDWNGIGKSVIEGIWDGMASLKGWLQEKISSLTDSLPAWVKDALGISSPSKVFAEIGRDMIRGWIVGMEEMERQLIQTGQRIASGLVGAIGGQRSGIASMLGNVTSISDGFNNAVTRMMGGGETADTKEQARRAKQAKDSLDFLKQQMSLMELVQQAGMDVKATFAGKGVGFFADPLEMLKLSNEIAERLGTQLHRSIQLAAQGVDQQVETMRNARRSAEGIEEQFTSKQISRLDQYKNEIVRLDEEIAAAEERFLTTGAQDQLRWIESLDRQRDAAIQGMEDYLRRMQSVDSLLARIPTNLSDRAMGAVKTFTERHLDPLIQTLRTASLSNEASDRIMGLVRQGVESLEKYASEIKQVTLLEKQIAALMKDRNFGDQFQTVVDQTLTRLFDPETSTEQRTKMLDGLRQYAMQSAQLFDAFERVGAKNPEFDRLRTQHIEPLLKRLLDLNLTQEERTKLQHEYNQALQTAWRMENAQNRMTSMQERMELVEKAKAAAQELRDPLLLGRVFAGMDLTKDLSPQEYATALARFTDESVRIAQQRLTESLFPVVHSGMQKRVEEFRKARKSFDDIVGQFYAPAQTRIETLQSRLESMDEAIVHAENNLFQSGSEWSMQYLVTLQQNRQAIADEIRAHVQAVRNAEIAIAGIQKTSITKAQQAADDYKAKYIDPLFEMLKETTWPDNRRILLNEINTRSGQLNAYIAQMEWLSTWERDVSAGAGINAFTGKFKTDVIDQLRDRLFDVNLTEQQRLDIARQMVAEQNKLLALQEKQQRLDFLSQQLSMLDQIRKLAEDSEGAISMDSILGGVKLGMATSLDDLLAVTNRMIDAMISETNKKLGIRSPSAVFAQIGHYIMEGLASGMARSIDRPLSAIQGWLEPYSLQHRALTINMGGVSINNGMDEVMFRQFIQSTVEDML